MVSDQRPRHYPAVHGAAEAVRARFASTEPELADAFVRCFLLPLETTLAVLPDGTTFASTGDIPAMWLRDAAAQVRPFLGLAATDEQVRSVLRGLIERLARCIAHDPYANAFNPDPNGDGHRADRTAMSPWVWERKWELDSLCYPIQLLNDYWQATGDASVFCDATYRMLQAAVETMQAEQHHAASSGYGFWREEPVLPTDNLPFHGTGAPLAETGMVWSAFRPSDDACTYGYHVPSNMFATVVLGHLSRLAQERFGDDALAASADRLRAEIVAGIEGFAVVVHPVHGRIYAYETDGRGHHLLIDDANVPSLLSIPYLGYRPASDATYRTTRRFVLSPSNPYYVEGRHAAGIGSMHTPGRYVWPLSLAMQALTATDSEEALVLLRVLATTTAGTGLMHEAFDPDDPRRFTRATFAWACSLFAEAVLHWLGDVAPSARVTSVGTMNRR